jgi:uncharacterized membrane protein YoaK (UPF0700 family)
VSDSSSSGWTDARCDFRLPTLALFLSAFAAGVVDALSLLRYGVFVANQSGNVVHLGMGLAGYRPAWQVNLASILAFGLGGVVGTLNRRSAAPGLLSPPARALLLVIAVNVAWAGLSRWLDGHGPIGIERAAALAAVGAFGMGILAVVFVQTFGVSTTTTYQTGTVLRTAQSIIDWMFSRRSDRRRTRLGSLLGLVALIGYAGGGAAGARVSPFLEGPFVLALLVLVALLAMVRGWRVPPAAG